MRARMPRSAVRASPTSVRLKRRKPDWRLVLSPNPVCASPRRAPSAEFDRVVVVGFLQNYFREKGWQ